MVGQRLSAFKASKSRLLLCWPPLLRCALLRCVHAVDGPHTDRMLAVHFCFAAARLLFWRVKTPLASLASNLVFCRSQPATVAIINLLRRCPRWCWSPTSCPRGEKGSQPGCANTCAVLAMRRAAHPPGPSNNGCRPAVWFIAWCRPTGKISRRFMVDAFIKGGECGNNQPIKDLQRVWVWKWCESSFLRLRVLLR